MSVRGAYLTSVAASSRPLQPGPGHPLANLRSLALSLVTGEAEIVTTDGRIVTGHVSPHSTPTAIERSTFEVDTSTLRLSMLDGATFTSEIGTVDTSVDCPVVYLDQNHWIDMARVLTGSSAVAGARKEALEGFIDLARSKRILLPLSAAHLVETAKKGGRQRTDLARTMVELSRGWQMRSPLYVRAKELDQIFSGVAGAKGAGQPACSDVFTLTPEALWADQRHPRPRRRQSDDLPAEMAGLVNRISWAASMVDTLLDTDPEVSARGLELATGWASSFQELARHMRSNPSAKPYLRDLTRSRTVTDMGNDLPESALRAGLTPERFGEWLRQDAEAALSSTPALGRVREVLHLRLANADDRWEANDLNDVLYLCTAAGYADFVLGEKKTCSYLRRVQGRVPAGAQVYHRAMDALPEVAASLRADARTDDGAGNAEISDGSS